MNNETASQPSNAELALEWIDSSARPSVAGHHGDDALYGVACALYHGFDLGDGAIEALRHYNASKCSPPWNEARLAYKLKQAAGAPQKNKPGGLARWMLRKKGLLTFRHSDGQRSYVAAEPTIAQVKRLKFDASALAREVADVREAITWKWLSDRSPVTIEGCDSASFLDALYMPQERVLLFTDFNSQGQFIHWVGRCGVRLGRRPGVKGVKSELPKGGPNGVWFLSNPVTGEWKVNPRQLDQYGRPKISRRSEEVITAWRYLVLESDEANEADWLKFLAKLPLPIAAIYTSGGRSVHALVKVDADSKAWWDKFKAMIAPLFSKLGADPGALTAVRLTRLPGCKRGDREQKLLYLNPAPDLHGTAIIDGGNVICA